jgi:hypothetical protein
MVDSLFLLELLEDRTEIDVRALLLFVFCLDRSGGCGFRNRSRCGSVFRCRRFAAIRLFGLVVNLICH